MVLKQAAHTDRRVPHCNAACRETEAALELWSDLRTNVSTPSTFLVPGLPRSTSMRKRGRSGEPVQCSEANIGGYQTLANESDGDTSVAGASAVVRTDADSVAA
jgi:hypothetical protein